MQLKELVKNLSVHIRGSEETEVTAVTLHSKQATAGSLFIAKKGNHSHGNIYIADAVANGAAVILSDDYQPHFSSIVQLVHPHPHLIAVELAHRFYQFPATHLWMVGITGTNGKTTTSYIIKYLLDEFYGPCGLIGTMGYVVGEKRYPATHTTPDLMTNCQLLREMVDGGCRSAVMEVTSHALDQGRVDNIEYDVALFSNLTLDHLDYHHTMERYIAAKSLLFKNLKGKITHKKTEKMAIVNKDSIWSTKVLEECSASIFTYGIENKADLMASDIRLSPQGTVVDLSYRDEYFTCYFPLTGRFNVYNCLSALAVGIACSIPLPLLIEKMATLPPISGRLEPVFNNLGLFIYVDFAHTDDALMNVLSTLMETKKGRLITVFGCGGDRDKTKRAKMAAVSERYSDFTIVTSDNPRSEEPHLICKEVIQGFSSSEGYLVETDRYLAIEKAIKMAQAPDTILIAGKGHETHQIFSQKTIAFDDRQVAFQICQQLYREHL